MQVRELMTSDPAICLATDTLKTVLEAMRRRRCGFMPIVDSHASRQLVGVVTDRDVALHLAQLDQPASQVPVEGCMTRDPKTTHPDAELPDAAAVMEQAAVHRLPVVEQGRVVGVLSLKDVAVAARKGWRGAGPNVPERQLRDIMEAIAAAHVAGRA